VTIIDNLSTGSLDNLESINSNDRFEFVYGDILEIPALEYLVTKSDMVYHLAAAVGVKMVLKEPVLTIQTNVKGTERILTAANITKTRVLITSTSEVYGKSTKQIFSEEDDLLIGPPSHSRWSYAASKLLDEFYCTSYYRETGLPVNVVRLFNTVGPKQTGKYGMVLPRFVKNALEEKPLFVYGTGKQSRCFCHVNDAVSALLGFLEVGSFGEIYNIGSQESCTIENLAKKVIALTGSTSPIEYVPYDKAYAPGFEDMLHRAPKIEKIWKLLNWKPKHSLDQIVRDVAGYYRKQ
jgi:UDP-glucose 4-epimerase